MVGHHVQQLPEPQHPHAVGVSAVDGGGQVAESDEAVASHVGIEASLVEGIYHFYTLGESLTSWGTDFEE